MKLHAAYGWLENEYYLASFSHTSIIDKKYKWLSLLCHFLSPSIFQESHASPPGCSCRCSCCGRCCSWCCGSGGRCFIYRSLTSRIVALDSDLIQKYERSNSRIAGKCFGTTVHFPNELTHLSLSRFIGLLLRNISCGEIKGCTEPGCAIRHCTAIQIEAAENCIAISVVEDTRAHSWSVRCCSWSDTVSEDNIVTVWIVQ